MRSGEMSGSPAQKARVIIRTLGDQTQRVFVAPARVMSSPIALGDFAQVRKRSADAGGRFHQRCLPAVRRLGVSGQWNPAKQG